jgi:hypothetical protein
VEGSHIIRSELNNSFQSERKLENLQAPNPRTAQEYHRCFMYSGSRNNVNTKTFYEQNLFLLATLKEIRFTALTVLCCV